MNRHIKNRPKVEIYTDGSCLGNPGHGGWAALIRYEKTGVEYMLSKGYTLTTNNRMELMAVLAALQTLRFPCRVVVFSDSRYVTNGVQRKRFKNKKPKYTNKDLWLDIGKHLRQYDIQLAAHWIKGHRQHPENTLCDEQAGIAARIPLHHKIVDQGYLDILAGEQQQ